MRAAVYSLAIMLALAMVLCMIPVSFAATTTIDNDSYDLAVSIIGKDGNVQGEWTTKDDANSITFKYDYEDADDVEAVITGKFTEDAKMAMVKVTGFMPLDSVDEITIDGKKLEVNDLAVYSDRIENNYNSLTQDPAYLLFPVELTKSGYTDTYYIEVTGTAEINGSDVTVEQSAKITVTLENTSSYKNAKTATISKIESTDRDEFDAYIVGSKIYLDVVASEKKAEDFLHDLKLTFKDNNGDLFDVVTWAYSASSEAGDRLSIFKIENEGGKKLKDSAVEYTVRLGAAEGNAKLMNDVVFGLETETAIYETKEYDVVVRTDVYETDPKGIYFEESSITLDIGESYTPNVLGVATGRTVDAVIEPGDGTSRNVIDIEDDDTIIGTQEGTAYVTATYQFIAEGGELEEYTSSSMKVTVTDEVYDGESEEDTDDDATSTYMVTASTLNVRTGPSTSYSKASYQLTSGELVEVVDIANGWAQLSDGNYVSAQYLMAVTTSDDGSATTMYVTCRTLNVRTGPSTSYSKVGTLSRGTSVEVVGTYGNWAKLSNGYYVSLSYLSA